MYVAAEEYERIRSQWIQACQKVKITLPPAAESELKKRIKAPGKAKLDLFKCGLDDRMVTLLVEVLSEAPVISKIELGGNYTSDQSAICLIRLLILQAKQVRDTPIDQRLTAVYMGDVSFDQSKSIIQEKIIEDIAVVCGALRHANMKTRIRECFIRIAGATGVMLNSASMDRLYIDVTGRKSDKTFLHKCDASLLANPLTYGEVEKLIISDLVDQGLLPLLSAKQEKLITEGLAGPGRKPAGSGSATPQKPDPPTPTATPPPPPPVVEAEKQSLVNSAKASSNADVPETTPTFTTDGHPPPKKIQVKIRTPNRSTGGIAKNAPPVSSDNSRRVSEKSSEPNSVGVSAVPSRSESPRGRPSEPIAASNPTPPPATTVNTTTASDPSTKPAENPRTSKVNSLLTKINSRQTLVAKSPSTDMPLTVGVNGPEERDAEIISPTREETQAMANEFQAKLDESRRHTSIAAPSQRLEPHDSSSHTGMIRQTPMLDDFVSTPNKEEQTPTNKENLMGKNRREEETAAAATAAAATAAAAAAAASVGDRRPVSRPRAKVVMKQRDTNDKAQGLEGNNNNDNNNNKDKDNESTSRVTALSNQETSDQDDNDSAIARTIIKLQGELETQERKIVRLSSKLNLLPVNSQQVTDTTDDDEVDDKKHTRSPSHALPREDDNDDDITTSTLPPVTILTTNTTASTNPDQDIPPVPLAKNEPEPSAEDAKENKVSALRARLNARKKASGAGSIDKDMNLLNTASSGNGVPPDGSSSTSTVVNKQPNSEGTPTSMLLHEKNATNVVNVILPSATMTTTDSAAHHHIITPVVDVEERPEVDEDETPSVLPPTATVPGDVDGFRPIPSDERTDQNPSWPSSSRGGDTVTESTTTTTIPTTIASTSTRAQITAQLGRPPVIVKPMVATKSSSSSSQSKSPTMMVGKSRLLSMQTPPPPPPTH